MAEEIVWGAGMDDRDFNRGIQKMLKDIEALKQKVKEAGEASKKSSKETGDGMDKAAASVGRMALSVVSIQTAWKLATAEYQNYLDVQKDAASETISTADAQIGFLRNLGNVSREQRTKVLADMKAIAAEVNQPVKNLFIAGQSSISAKGMLSQQQMLDSLKLAFQVAPESVDEAKSIAGALGDVASLTGHGDPQRNMAFLLEANKQARAETLTQIAKGSLGRAISIKSFGGEGSDALALTNTFSNVMKDPDGQLSATAAMRLASQLNEHKVPGTSTLERIQHLQNNPQAFKRFFARASFEGGIGEQPARAVATAGTEAAQLLTQNVAGMRGAGGPGSGAMVQGFVNDLGGVPEQQVAATSRQLAARVSEFQVANREGAATSVVRDRMDEMLKAAGQGSLARTLGARMFDVQTAFGADPRQVAASRIEEFSQELAGVKGGATGKRAEDIKMLQQIVTELRGMRADNKGPKKKNVDRHTE